MRSRFFVALALALLWCGGAQAACKLATDYGLVTYNVIAAASDNHANIFPSPGIACYVSVSNTTATVNYLRLYNAGSGFNGCNSATGLIGYWPIPASTSVGGREINITEGLSFSTGLSICISSGAGFTDTTNATNPGVSVVVGYSGR